MFIFSLRCQAESVDPLMLWNVCAMKDSHIEICQNLDNEKEKQVRALEESFFLYTTNWQRNALTAIYYVVSNKFVIEHHFHTKPVTELRIFFNRDSATFNIGWSF